MNPIHPGMFTVFAIGITIVVIAATIYNCIKARADKRQQAQEAATEARAQAVLDAFADSPEPGRGWLCYFTHAEPHTLICNRLPAAAPRDVSVLTLIEPMWLHDDTAAGQIITAIYYTDTVHKARFILTDGTVILRTFRPGGGSLRGENDTFVMKTVREIFALELKKQNNRNDKTEDFSCIGAVCL